MTQRFDLHGQEAYAIGYEEGRRETLIEAAKATCWMCAREGWTIEKHPFGDNYIHRHPKMPRTYDCLANPIRLLIAADQSKGK